MKAAVHTVALATAAVCGAYNIAAWLVRRQKHLAVNALFYSAAVIWEIGHVRHHLAARPAPQPVRLAGYDELQAPREWLAMIRRRTAPPSMMLASRDLNGRPGHDG